MHRSISTKGIWITLVILSFLTALFGLIFYYQTKLDGIGEWGLNKTLGWVTTGLILNIPRAVFGVFLASPLILLVVSQESRKALLFQFSGLALFSLLVIMILAPKNTFDGSYWSLPIPESGYSWFQLVYSSPTGFITSIFLWLVAKLSGTLSYVRFPNISTSRKTVLYGLHIALGLVLLCIGYFWLQENIQLSIGGHSGLPDFWVLRLTKVLIALPIGLVVVMLFLSLSNGYQHRLHIIGVGVLVFPILGFLILSLYGDIDFPMVIGRKAHESIQSIPPFFWFYLIPVVVGIITLFKQVFKLTWVVFFFWLTTFFIHVFCVVENEMQGFHISNPYEYLSIPFEEICFVFGGLMFTVLMSTKIVNLIESEPEVDD